MRRLSIQLFMFFGLVAILIAGAWGWYRSEIYSDDAYMLVYGMKHERARSLSEEKLIIVGGSNGAFGFDSKKLGSELGLEVANLAYHAGHGIEYRLNEALPHLGKGDVVLLSIEYQILHGYRSGPILWRTFSADQSCIQYFGWGTWKEFFDTALLFGIRKTLRESKNYLTDRQRPTFNHPYRLDSFNEFGDVFVHRGMPSRDREPFGGDIIEVNQRALEHSIKALNRFSEYCRTKGAAVYFSYPPLPEGVYRDTRSKLVELDDLLRDRLEIPILEKIDEFEYPDNLFFDTYCHLTDEGIQRRTAALIEALGLP